MPTRKNAHPQSPVSRRPTGRAVAIATVLVCLWLLLFLRASFTWPLANQTSFSRIDLIFLLPAVSTLFSSIEGAPIGWAYFPERFDLIGVALLISLGACSWGRLLCRLFGHFGDDWLERLAIAGGLGLSFWSLITLFAGLLGWLDQRLFLGLLAIAIVVESGLTILDYRRKSRTLTEAAPADRPSAWLRYLCLLIVAVFIGRALLGSMLPPTAFDVREYHLGGPKEWFLDGHIHFLAHNVYTSFPFLTEMLSLSAMVVRDDWYHGAMAGKLLLAMFIPLATLGVYITGRRLFGGTAALGAMLIFATTPWAYRITAIAYAEGGLTCYLILSLFSCIRALTARGGQQRRWVLITGLLAGSAMACKYTGVVQVVIPLGVALVAGCVWKDRESSENAQQWKHALTAAVVYSIGLGITIGPWLLKNLVETGNPVYPLAWTIFGGFDWNAELNAKWLAAHHASDYSLVSLISGLKSIAITNDWQSVLVVALAPLAVVAPYRRYAGYIALYLLWLLLTWWGLTHRIDRFWVPLLPVLCLLSGLGMIWIRRFLPSQPNETGQQCRILWRWVCGVVVMIGVAFNALFITSPLIGNPFVLRSLSATRKIVENPNIATLNKILPPEAKLLLVGEAAIFDARFPLAYNTVFDKSLFELWTANSETNTLKSTAAIREKLRTEGITHIFVNWKEILRYRTTYGYTEFVTPERFEALKQRGILAEPVIINTFPFARLNEQEQREAKTRFPSLVHGSGEDREFVAGQVFAVVGHTLPPLGDDLLSSRKQ